MKLGTVMTLVSVAEGQDPLKTRVEKVADQGLQVMGVFLRPEWQQPAHLEEVRELAAKRGVELRLGTGGNFYKRGDEGKIEVDRVAATLKVARKHLGTTFSSIAPLPMSYHRWAPGDPLEERKAALSENLRLLADAVAGDGVTLGVENHCDWRGHEVVEFVTRANRPNLKMQLDSGNPFSVFEEPIDCAKVMAPYTVSVHLKDIHVTPFASGEVRGTRGVSVPLGEGHVDNVTICQILQEKAPDPANLALMVEPFYLDKDQDPDQFLATSIAWARTALAPFLS